LSGAGFCEIRLEGISGPMWFGADTDNAHAFVLVLMGWMLEGLDDAQRDQAIGRLKDTLSHHRTASGVTFDSAAWLVTATR
jgi:hypothetical protein